MLNTASRVWDFYRRYGLLSLLRAVSENKHRAIPFHYRVALRRTMNELRYGPGAVTEPLRVHWVRPETVQYNGPTFSHEKYIGTVRSGDWDEERTRLTHEEMYRGLRDRFVEECAWENTRYLAFAEQQFEEGDEWLGHTSLESFEENRLPYLDQIYADIEENGYKPQSELTADSYDEKRHGSVPDYHSDINEITCNIARDGELLLNNGIHRISIAKMLDLDQIPIQIVARHEGWQEIRTAVAESDQRAVTASEYGVDQSHPDLQQLCRSDGARTTAPSKY